MTDDTNGTIAHFAFDDIDDKFAIGLQNALFQSWKPDEKIGNK